MRRQNHYGVKTPLGWMSILVHDGLPLALALRPEARRRAPGRTPTPPIVVEIANALDAYFAGVEVHRDLAHRLIACIEATTFMDSVLREVARIPWGDTASYGEVARRAGHPRAARAVGNVMRSNPFPVIIPCHRVIRGDGSIGGYGGHEHVKTWLLQFEARGRIAPPGGSNRCAPPSRQEGCPLDQER